MKFIKVSEEMIFSDAFNNINAPSIRILMYILSHKDTVCLRYSTFYSVPFNMGASTIARAIDSLLEHGFVSPTEKVSVYNISNKWEDWMKGDEPVFTRSSAPTTVYFIKEKASGFIKIGKTSREISKRVNEINGLAPGGAELIGVLEDAPTSLENELHKKFENERTNGEWFNLNAKQIKYIHTIIKVSAK